MPAKKKSKKKGLARAKLPAARSGKAVRAGAKKGAKKGAKAAKKAGAAPREPAPSSSQTSRTPVVTVTRGGRVDHARTAISNKPLAPRSKRARRKRSPMTATQQALTRAEQAIMERMAALEPTDPRYRVLESALAFKASWVILGEHLNEVYENRLYKSWGYASFARYCSDEIRVTSGTARKLVRSYQWLDDEAPELIPRASTDRVREITRPVPDFNAIGVLADARKKYNEDQVTEDAYLQLKMAALDGDRTAAQLRKELKESIPEELRGQDTDPVRSLRKALNASVRCLEALREWDGSDELLIQAESLRDAIAHHMPRRADGEAPALPA